MINNYNIKGRRVVMIIELERKGCEVFCNGAKVRIVPQASKGPNKEVVDIEKFAGPNYQKWISLSTLNEGMNEVELKPRKIVESSKKYVLTAEEQARVDELQSEIDAIIETAKSRYVPTINLNKVDPSKMSKEETNKIKSLLPKSES